MADASKTDRHTIPQKATDRIQIRYLNWWVKDKICEAGMDYLNELAAVLLPDNDEGKTQINIIASNHPQNVKACFSEFFNVWSERVVDATWQRLMDALVETKRTQLAVEIGAALTPPVKIEE